MSFNDKAFHASGDTVTLAVTTGSSVSSRTAIGVDGTSPQVMAGNNSTDWAFVAFGTSTVEASATDYMLAPGETTYLHPGKATYASAITLSTSGSVYLTPGAGR